MSMHATRVPDSEVTSGTFETDKPRDTIAEAHKLACDIERLLAHTSDDSEAYGKRLARALAQSLIDQLAELSRERNAKAGKPA
jgi:hypothetical protein